MAFSLATIVEPQFLSNAAAELFSATLQTRIDALSVCNTDTADHTVTIYLVPNGLAAGASTTTTLAQTVKAGQTWNSPNEVGKVLSTADSLWAMASTAGVMSISCGGLVQF